MSSKFQILGDYLDFVIVKYPELPAPYHAYHFEEEIPKSSKAAVDGYTYRGAWVWPLVAETYSDILSSIHDYVKREAENTIEKEL